MKPAVPVKASAQLKIETMTNIAECPSDQLIPVPIRVHLQALRVSVRRLMELVVGMFNVSLKQVTFAATAHLTPFHFNVIKE